MLQPTRARATSAPWHTAAPARPAHRRRTPAAPQRADARCASARLGAGAATRRTRSRSLVHYIQQCRIAVEVTPGCNPPVPPVGSEISLPDNGTARRPDKSPSPSSMGEINVLTGSRHTTLRIRKEPATSSRRSCSHICSLREQPPHGNQMLSPCGIAPIPSSRECQAPVHSSQSLPVSMSGTGDVSRSRHVPICSGRRSHSS